MIVILHGSPVDFDACIVLIDDEIREVLHAEGIDDEQEFLDRYVEAHAAKYDGEEFQI